VYELCKAGENSYYLECPAKIGICLTGKEEVCLIDSGNDKDAGKKVRQILEHNGWSLKKILNTHSHADHIGGNHYLQGQTGCKIYAPGMEKDFINHPIMEPTFLYGGYPPKDLKHKFLMAQESEAELLTQEILPEGMSILDIPGHSYDMAGFRTSDDVVFLADCLSSKDTLEKYQISFLTDVAAYLSTLEMVKTLKAKLFIPAHAAAAEDIVPLAQLNIDKVNEIAEQILHLCQEPRSFEMILQMLFQSYGLTMNFEQYVLVGSTVRSYLAWLKDTGKIDVSFEQAIPLWFRV